MKTLNFNRSDIYFFDELTPSQQKHVTRNHLDKSLAVHTTYVLLNNKPLPLTMFLRCDTGIWDGYYNTPYFSAYFIKFNRDCSQALICERCQ